MDTDSSNLGSIAEDAGNGSGSDLDVVRAQFDDWRSRHPGRRHIPDALWVAAISLLKHYPISVVSSHLRLNSARLQQQEKALSGASRTRRKKRGTKLSAPESSVDFLQLAAQDVTVPPSVAQEACSIIIERGDGSRFTVRAPANSHIIESLCASFLRQ